MPSRATRGGETDPDVGQEECSWASCARLCRPGGLHYRNCASSSGRCAHVQQRPGGSYRGWLRLFGGAGRGEGAGLSTLGIRCWSSGRDCANGLALKNFELITVDPAQMGGVPCVRHLRIPVATVLRMLAGGLTSADILWNTRISRPTISASVCVSPRLRPWSGNCPSRVLLEISD